MGGRSAGSAVRLTLLDGFALRTDGEALQLPVTLERVIAFVALRQRGVHRAVAAGTLWPTASEEHAQASLRSALWRLRCMLRVPLVDGARDRLALDGDVAVDVHAQRAAVRRALDAATPYAGYCLELEGDLLPGWYEDWVLLERERLRQLRLHALEALTGRLIGAERHADALETALAAIAGDPLRETAHQALVRVHLAEGNVVEALRQYEAYSNLLRRHVGLEPSRRLRELVEPLLASRPATARTR